MAYVTDFSSETFGMYVGIIYCGMYRPKKRSPNPLTQAQSKV
jgi:hypothetical protein